MTSVGLRVLVLAAAVVCGVDGQSGQGGVPGPYGDVLNDDGAALPESPDLVVDQQDQASPDPGLVANSTQPTGASLRCIAWPGGGIGSPVSCPEVCERECEGVAPCPCNGDVEGECWVPKARAAWLCAGMHNCHVLSELEVVRDEAMKAYEGWVHVGALPVLPRRGWNARVCDKEQSEGCYECTSDRCLEDDSDRAKCFAHSYDLRLYSNKTPFCVEGNSLAACTHATEQQCCEFSRNAHCDVATGSCVPNARLCSSDTVSKVLAADSRDGDCTMWMRAVQARTRPSLEATCACLNVANAVLGLMVPDFECAVVPRTHSIRHMAEVCQQRVPCSESDRCGGCVTYRDTPDTWLDLVSPNALTRRCDWHPIRKACVLIGQGGVLQENNPCSTEERRVAISDEWYYTESRTSDLSTRQAVPKPDFPAFEDVPLPLRKDPGLPSKLAPSPEPIPSPSTSPLPVPVDTTITFVGHAREHRHYLDAVNGSLSVVMACTQFPGNGSVTGWSVYAGRAGRLHVQVLRPAESPEVFANNTDPVSAFDVVGESVLHVPGLGHYTFELPVDQRVRVRKGDVIGFYSETGIVAWSEGGEKVLWRYGRPSTPTYTLPVLLQQQRVVSHATLFIGEGEARTYSLAAKGSFNGKHIPVTPTSSPSRSSSVTPSRSPSPSPSPTPTGSESPSASPAPSAVPCSQGSSFWCANEIRRVQCNITRALWTRVCRPPPLQCAESPRCPEGFVPSSPPLDADPPCFVASRDCVPSPCVGSRCNEWENDNVSFFPPTARNKTCPYCMGGADWTGKCAKGTQQSPVKIEWDSVDVESSMMLQVEPSYNVVTAPLIHSGWGLVMNTAFGSIKMDGIDYDAQTVILRAPAEHQIEGEPRAALEVQIVHTRRFTNETVVVAVLMDEGEATDSPAMLSLLNTKMPSRPGQRITVAGFDLNGIVSDEKPMAWYSGSLTIPPCTEGVTWAVQMGANPVLSHDQIALVNAVFKSNPDFAKGRGNNRVLQPLNGRKITLKSNCSKTGAIACPRGGPSQEELEAQEMFEE